MKHRKITQWAKKHFCGLLISFVTFCTLLGIWVGIVISMEEDAP
jgi:hypothetical protein